MNSLKKTAIAALLPLAFTVNNSVNAGVSGDHQLHPTKDIGVINLERVEYWLKKRGEIKPGATEQEIQQILAEYQSRAANYSEPKFIKGLIDRAQNNKNERLNKISNQSSSAKSMASKTVKVLAVMIDFPDLLHSSHGLTASDTNMYYPSYPVSHYQELMFSTSTYTGPNGEDLKTAYTFYQEESGGEFFFTGDSYGWVTADNNAATYGGNDADNDEGDIDVPSLIKEAVEKAVSANSINLDDYDLEDPYDLNGNGNLNEPDGFIDHVMVFHSSIGEEAGGGRLGDDAIWSHRFRVNQTGNVSTMGHAIPGSTKKLFDYTIQPIDSAIGVVVHEFGHDLGLPDEYDTETNRGSGKGSPVGIWSVMSGGSWAGTISGSQPTGFSTYARSYLQQRHGANWINETVIQFDSLAGPQDIELVEAVNHSAGSINQVKIEMPQISKTPYQGDFQYHSGGGDNLTNSLTFDINVPDSNQVQLTMKANWNIEYDWDFVRVLFNDTAIAGNHTTATNPYTGQYPLYDNATHYLTGVSSILNGAEGPVGWVDLTYDISSLRGQSVTVKIEYTTDSNTGGVGFFADNIRLVSDGNETLVDDAESAGTANLSGFTRANGSLTAEPQNYWVQLRSHNGTDSGLPTRGYDRGIVIWFADQNFSDNKSSVHPGGGFIGVVDADQTLIGTSGSSVQVRDAAFSKFSQLAYSGDSNLTPRALFSDSDDYSSPGQEESGIKLPVFGLNIEVIEQANDSSTATIRISKQAALNAAFDYAYSGTDVTFTNSSTFSGNVTYDWNFGDGSATSNETNPTHDYGAEGEYSVTLTVTDDDTSDSDSITQTVRVGALPEANFTSSVSEKTVTFSNSTSGGIGSLSYSWNFGDGNSSTEEAPTHTYSSDGSYTVQLTVTDSTGASDIYSGQVTISTTTQPPASGSSSGGGGSIFWTLLLLPLIKLRKRN